MRRVFSGHRAAAGHRPLLAETRGKAVGVYGLQAHAWLGERVCEENGELVGPGRLERISGCSSDASFSGLPRRGCIFPPIPHFDGLSFSGQGTMSCSSLCPQHVVGA